MEHLKIGDEVVVTANKSQLRGNSCNPAITPKGVYMIAEVGTRAVRLNVSTSGWVEIDWVELANQYADADWV